MPPAVRPGNALSPTAGLTGLLICSALVLMLPAAALAVEIRSIRLGVSPEKTRVVFDLSAPAAFQMRQLDNPARVIVDLQGATPVPDSPQSATEGTLIKQMDVSRLQSGGTRYTFFLAVEMTPELFILKPYLERGDRLVLDLHPLQESAPPTPIKVSAQAVTAPDTHPTGERNGCSKRDHKALPQSRPADVDYAGEWTGYVSLDARLFLQDPAYDEQDRHNASVALRPEYFADWAEGSQRLSFIPFYRYDANDSKRTHGDIRELFWQIDYRRMSFKAGIDVVFWGVVESQHLVDIINQTDLVENLDGEEKLGQPMLNLDYFGDWGSWQFYVLPYFRERTFPGQPGRLRNDPPVDMDGAIYQSSDKNDHIDYALRWSRAIGPWDVGLAHFSGTSREAALLLSTTKPKPALVPFYPQIDQTSLDAQATIGAWLWKLEAIYNQNDYDDYYAYVAGFEYTNFGITGSGADLGWLLEYHYDQRGDLSSGELIPSSLENDLYLGVRWTGNDLAGTRLLSGVVVDLDSQSIFGNVEFSRRMGEMWRLDVEARFLTNIDSQDIFYFIRKDDYIGIEFTRYY